MHSWETPISHPSLYPYLHYLWLLATQETQDSFGIHHVADTNTPHDSVHQYCCFFPISYNHLTVSRGLPPQISHALNVFMKCSSPSSSNINLNLSWGHGHPWSPLAIGSFSPISLLQGSWGGVIVLLALHWYFQILLIFLLPKNLLESCIDLIYVLPPLSIIVRWHLHHYSSFLKDFGSLLFPI